MYLFNDQDNTQLLIMIRVFESFLISEIENFIRYESYHTISDTKQSI